MTAPTLPARPGRHCGPAAGLEASLVVIAGLPGSGKTTLLRRLLADEVPGVTGLDSEQVTARLRAAGVRLPYRLLRPVVHGLHRWRVLRGVGGNAPVVVLTDPWTSPRWRAAVLRTARCAGRSVRLVVLDASPAVAASGQAARGRAISARAMRRHTSRWEALRHTAADAGAGEPVVVDRRAAGRLTLGGILGRQAAPTAVSGKASPRRPRPAGGPPSSGRGRSCRGR
jgi:predicted kinase